MNMKNLMKGLTNKDNLYDNGAGLVDWVDPKKSFSIEVKTKRKKVDIDALGCEQLSDKLLEAQIRLDAYSEFPDDVKAMMKDQIVGTAKFIALLKVQIKLIATPHQLTFLKHCDEQFKTLEAVKIKLSEKEAELKKANSELTQLKNDFKTLQDGKAQIKASEKLKRIEISRDRNLLIHENFKFLVREHIGESNFLNLIEKASLKADETLNQ